MWSITPTPVRNLFILLNFARVSSFFRRVFDTFKHDGFLWKFKLKHIVIKWTHPNRIKDPSPSQEPPHPHKLQQSVIILQEGSWRLQTWWIFMKLEIKAYCHKMNTFKMWSRTQAQVRNLHILLNSIRVSSFFRRVLDTFKHDGFLWKFKHKLIAVSYTHLTLPTIYSV